MKHLFRTRLMAACLALPVALLAGSKGKIVVKSFVPPVPAPSASEASIIEGPEFDSRLLAKELPLMFAAGVPSGPRALEAELRLRRAEDHFRKGKDLVAKGELPAARVEFDNAIEEISSASPVLSLIHISEP